jgi:hypothetical protein
MFLWPRPPLRPKRAALRASQGSAPSGARGTWKRAVQRKINKIGWAKSDDQSGPDRVDKITGNDISPRRASHYPNRTVALHPKAPRCVRQTGLMHLAGRVVALVQNDGLICLRHAQTVPVLVQSVNLPLGAIEFIEFGSPRNPE